MAWPPLPLPTDRTNNTAKVDLHPGDHNDTARALNDTVDKLKLVVPGHFQARRTTTLAVATGTYVDIPMPTTDETTVASASWDGTTYTIGAAGLYSVGWGIQWANNSVGARVGFVWDGTNRIACQEVQPKDFCAISGQAIRRFASGTLLVVRGLHTVGSSLNVDGSFGRTYFTITPLMLG